MSRDERQERVAVWCERAFGHHNATNVQQRAVRFLEEAIELYQAAGGELAMAHKLLYFVFARPVGNLHQELGGSGVTLLALAAAAGYSAELAEIREIMRCFAKPLEQSRARNEAKNAAGFEVQPVAKS